MKQRDNTIQKAFNTRINIAKQKYPYNVKKEIILFDSKKISVEDKQQAYLEYSGKMLEFFDSNKDGKVEIQEYQQGILNLYYEIHKDRYSAPNDERNLISKRLNYLAEKCFKSLDKNKDKFLSKEEYATFTQMCDSQGEADGKFTLEDEETSLHEIYRKNPFIH